MLIQGVPHENVYAFLDRREERSKTRDAGVLLMSWRGWAGPIHVHDSQNIWSAVEMKGYTWR